MAAATESATAGSSFAPLSIVATMDLYTALGSRACISALVKTLEPNTWPGVSPGSRLIAGGTYASTLVIAARRTALPLNLSPYRHDASHRNCQTGVRLTLRTIGSGNVTSLSHPRVHREYSVPMDPARSIGRDLGLETA